MTETQLVPSNWRSCGAIVHIEYSLQEIEQLFQELTSLYLSIPISKHRKANLRCADKMRFEEFCELYEPIIRHECKIAYKAELACLMSSIQVESEINRFVYFTCGPDFVTSTGQLSPQDRLLAATNVDNTSCSCKMSVVEAIRVLSHWRDIYIHGHSPVRLYQANQTAQQTESTCLPYSLAELMALIGAYLRVVRFIRQINHNPHTSSASVNEQNIRSLLNKITKYCFDGDKWSLKATLDKREQAKIVKIISRTVSLGNNTQRMLLENCFATLSPEMEQIMLMESGLAESNSHFRSQIIAEAGLSTKELLYRKSIALSSISAIRYLFPSSS